METRAFIKEEFVDTFFYTTFKHPKTLEGVLGNVTAQEFQLVVTLAAQALKDLYQKVSTVQYTEMLDGEIKRHTDLFESEKAKIQEDIRLMLSTNKNEIARLQTASKVSSSELNAEIKALKAELAASEYGLSKMREQFDTVKDNAEIVLKISIEEIVRQKQDQYEKELQRIQSAHKVTCEGLEKQARERVQQCDLQHKESLEHMRTLYSEQEKKIRKELEKSFVSSERGKQGEQDFEDIARQYTSWPPMINMSKTSHGTDRMCKIRNCNSLFEIKNYTSDIPSKEVEKFERDMAEHHDYPMGVFISMNTNIVGKKSGKFITMTWTPKSQLLLYINSFYDHSPDDVLTFIDVCADISWTMFKMANDTPQESESVAHLEMRISQARVYVEKEIKRMTEMMRSVTYNKSFMIEAINKQSAEYSYNIQQSKQALQGMLEILLGRCDYDEGSQDSSSQSQEVNLTPVVILEPPTPQKKIGAKKTKATNKDKS
jgi:hypothetical protein